MTETSRCIVVVQLSRGATTAGMRLTYPAITSIRGYWRQVGRYSAERLL